jgi:amino acid permease
VQIFGLNVEQDKMLDIDFNRFSIVYCSIIVCALMFPLIVKKEINFLLKINSLGVYCVILIIIFIIYNFIKSLLNTSFDFEYIENSKDSPVRHLHLFGPDISKLAGMLSLGYFSHSIILPILKNNEKQENNKRDLFFGYLLVCFTYSFIGITGYIGFSGSDFEPQFNSVSYI